MAHHPHSTLDTTCSTAGLARRRLAQVLEGYLADLERGVALDQEAFLAAHAEMADELRPYLDSLQLLIGATGNRAPNSNEIAPESASPELGERHIGDYRIVREIGRGGMGIVYEAHQKSLNRQVALKVLPFAAVLDQRQIARFRNEAQAAAQLHHPHIVPVFAVGQEQGVYYYAMQYIAGKTLAAVIDGMRNDESGMPNSDSDPTVDAEEFVLGARYTAVVDNSAIRIPKSEIANREPRLANPTTGTRPVAAISTLRSTRPYDFFRTVARLGKEAAEALQHAHEYGIVHRDIKPSNLLVDEEGKLWVTDFGLARVQAGSGVTLTGDVVGTLRYMSPEQASGQGALVDSRSDVYSLGVTLYELLTQRPAFPGDDRQRLLQQIVVDEPPSPRRINPGVPADLETIVLTAMAKSRDDRYESARALADDLERFLTGKPTLARRPAMADRMAKWARRHRPFVLLAGCALVAITLVSAIGMALLIREQAKTAAALADAEANARLAKASFARAERHFEQARGAVDQFGMRLADRLLEVPGAEPVRRQLLLDTLRYYQQFLAEAGGDPQLRHELALAHFKSAVVAAKLGAVGDAVVEYQAAQKLLAELLKTHGSPVQPLSQLATAHNNLGLLLATQGQIDGAQREYESAIAIQERLSDRFASDPEFASQLAETWANRGMLSDQIGDSLEAERSLRVAVDRLRPFAQGAAPEPKYVRNLAIGLNNLSYVLRNRQRQAAEAAAREAIALLERLAETHLGGVVFHDDLALCYNNLASLVSRDNRISEAIAWHGKAIELQERLVRVAPAVVRHRSDLAVSLNNLGVAHCRAGNETDADTSFERAQKLLATLAGDYPDEVSYQSSLAALLNNQALALVSAGRHEDALAVYRQAIESQKVCWRQRPESAMMRDVLSKMYFNFGQALQNAGRLSEAAEAALARREVWQADGERLLGVAAELARIAELKHAETNVVSPNAQENPNDLLARNLENEVLATLRLARERGWPRNINLASDERFGALKRNERFAALLADLNQPDQQGYTRPGASVDNKASIDH